MSLSSRVLALASAVGADIKALLARNEYTTTEKTKLAGIETGAQVNKPAPSPVVSKTEGATLALSDAGRYISASSDTAIAFEVPPQSVVAWVADTEITFEQTGAGVLTFNPGVGVTLNRMSTNTLTTAGQFGVVTLKRTGPDTWTLLGALGVV